MNVVIIAKILLISSNHNSVVATVWQKFFATESKIQNSCGAIALHPYYRESRRLVGVTTVRQDILPIPGGNGAALYIDSIAIGNYIPVLSSSCNQNQSVGEGV